MKYKVGQKVLYQGQKVEITHIVEDLYSVRGYTLYAIRGYFDNDGDSMVNLSGKVWLKSNCYREEKFLKPLDRKSKLIRILKQN